MYSFWLLPCAVALAPYWIFRPIITVIGSSIQERAPKHIVRIPVSWLPRQHCIIIAPAPIITRDGLPGPARRWIGNKPAAIFLKTKENNPIFPSNDRDPIELYFYPKGTFRGEKGERKINNQSDCSDPVRMLTEYEFSRLFRPPR